MKTKKVILFVMLIVMCLPVISSIIGFGNIYEINENRYRKEFPVKDDILDQGFTAINEWYNDCFGLRDVLIRLQHQIDYSIFHYRDNLYFGSDENGNEYIFMRSILDKGQIANEKLTVEEQDAILNQFQRAKNKIESQGMDFKFIIAPQKNEILTKESADIPISRPDYDMYDIMEDKFLKSSLADNYVPVLDTLKSKNEIAPVYYYTDFHWNDWGAACAFGKLVNDYSAEQGLGKVYDVDALQISTFTFPPEELVGQLPHLSVLSYDMPEDYTADIGNESSSYGIIVEEHPEWNVFENKDSAVFEKAVLFLGDSYTPSALVAFNGTSSGIPDLFPRVYFCHWDYAEGILDHIPDDVGLVVMECIEDNYNVMDTMISTQNWEDLYETN